MQDVFLRAFRGLPKWRGDGDVGTWLHRIAYNASLDEFDRQRRRPVVPVVDEHDSTSTSAFDAVDDRSAIAGALVRLSPEHRTALLLVDVEGFDYQSAGAVLGIAAGTVSSRVSRARASLRAHLAEQEVR